MSNTPASRLGSRRLLRIAAAIGLLTALAGCVVVPAGGYYHHDYYGYHYHHWDR